MARRSKDEPQVIGFLGIGLDQRDEEKRVTHSEHFLLVGGSEETHGRLQDAAIYFEEGLKERGVPLAEASAAEVLDLLRKAMDR